MSFKVHVSLGALRGMRPQAALDRARSASEPFWGGLSTEQVQICPQNPGTLTPEEADRLARENPDVCFRLHANARAEGWNADADASTYAENRAYFERLVAISKSLRAPAYTWHAGRRRSASLARALGNTLGMQDRMGVPVGIEPMYPHDAMGYLLSTWDEYAQLLESGVNYALDLSHVNILVHKTGERRDALLKELISGPGCLEIHVSANDGTADKHRQIATRPWWLDFLDAANPAATVFSEGGQTVPIFI